MLPFLKHKKQTASLIVSTRKPDGNIQESHSEGDEDSAMKAAAEDIMRAITSKDPQHLALALRAAFQILEAEPHEEGPHEENDYDSLNAKAAKDGE